MPLTLLLACALPADGAIAHFLGGELPGPSRLPFNTGDGTFVSLALPDFDQRVGTAAIGEFSGSGRVGRFLDASDAELSPEPILGDSR